MTTPNIVMTSQMNFDHPKSGVVYNYVCLSVCRVNFIYESHRVKVKVTGAKR